MISAARVLGWGGACAFLVAMGTLAEPASAQNACKNEVITATGRGKIAIRRQRQLEGGGSAMRDAIATWQREAEAQFGDDFKHWDRAKDAKFDCSPSGRFTVQCTISGRPCHSSSERREPDRVEIEGDDDNDRGERPRRRITEARRLDRHRYRHRRDRDDYVERYGYGYVPGQYIEDDDYDHGHRYRRRHYRHHHYRWGYPRNFCAETQYFLQACGYYVVQDGVCGPQTAEAVAHFQWRNGLYASGHANSWTREVLIRRCIR